MENNILREIVEVEKEIQQSIDRAKASASEWLDSCKKEIEEELARKEKEVLASFEQARSDTMRNAANRASDLVAETEKQADRMKHLKNETLSDIVMNHLHKILPG